MFEVIGKGKVTSFAILFLVTLFIWVAALGYLSHQNEQITILQNEAAAKTDMFKANISKMNYIVSIMRDRGHEYYDMRDNVVGIEQDRLEARRIIQNVKFSSDVPIVDYSISEERTTTDTFILDKGFDLSQSLIEMTLTAYTARDIFLFIERLKQDFDGILVLENFVIDKKQVQEEFNDLGDGMTQRSELSMLQQDLVLPRLQANLQFSWNSLQESQVTDQEMDLLGVTDF